MSDPEDAPRLAGYVETWWQAVQDLAALLDQVPDEQWSTPTDLAGWDVRACAAHTAHLESVLAGHPEETAEIGEPAHVTGLMGLYTEIGVVNRRDRSPAEIVAEIREVTGRRHQQLLADPPTDASAQPPVIFGGVPWTWEVLLRNRPLDVWMHEQDVRRAVGLPGGLDTRAAQHTADYLTESFGFVVAKKAGAEPGTTAVLDVVGSPTVAYAVTDARRGERLPVVPGDPTVTLRTDRETFVLLAGGRRAAAADAVTIEGDHELGARIVATMATTP
ncbi:maleylpyruvate isomerase family mycothiol-dependent enzyme [Nocardioides plantarum]|uniref:Maleylpyruvate isomerase family mycothiol-dependent enzyme n=1 Tax=Nocardioides plantarum TaxID=29299 RepID=A0ABV5K764_9ACTN|nr:maleylpyruvate isomerase family mycothiol-dependent enzyme [Nocardioides plantarum]